MKYLLVLLLLFLTFSSLAQSNDRLYQDEKERILKQRAEEKISILEAVEEIEAAGKVYFPTDALLNSYNSSIVRYARQLDIKEITETKFEELFLLRTERFLIAIEERNSAVKTEKNTRDEDARRRYIEQQEIERNANILKSIGNAFRNLNPPTTNCVTTNIGGVLRTTCR